jgi:hypothetical protein
MSWKYIAPVVRGVLGAEAPFELALPLGMLLPHHVLTASSEGIFDGSCASESVKLKML